MNERISGAADRSRVTRRSVLAASGALGVAGLAGCVEDLRGMVGKEAARQAVTTTAAMPAAFYGGDTLPEGGLVESDRADAYVPLSVSGERAGGSGSVELDGFAVTSTLRANNHNTTRSNRYQPSRNDPDADADGIGTLDDLYDYLGGDATIGERFVVAVPDARLKAGDGALAEELTPGRLLEYLTRDGETTVADAKGRIFTWDDAPRLSAAISVPDAGELEYDPSEQLLALGYEGDVNNATVLLRRPSLDSDSDSDGVADGEEWVYVSDGEASRAGRLDFRRWGKERASGEAAVTPTVVGSVFARPPDCPRPIPALLYLRRIRHDEQYLFVGGWVVDDHALYHDAVTMLVAEALPQVVGVAVQDTADAMRASARNRLTGDRALLGSVSYDGVLNEEALAFLPETHRSDGGSRALIERIEVAVDRRDSQTGEETGIALRDGDVPDEDAVKALLVPIDTPVLHVRTSSGCECPEPCCCCKILPAANNIPSR